MIKMSIDTDRVITEVRFRPALWDSSFELYKDRDAKTKAWHEVCQEVIPNFDNLSVIEKKLTEKQVQQRWKTARDAYVRSKTYGPDGGKRKKYMYFDCMHFLDKKHEDTKDFVLESQSTISVEQCQDTVSLNSKNDLLNSVTSSDQETSNSVASTSHTTSKKYTRLKRKLKQRKRKLDKDFKHEMLKMVNENMKLMQNDDMAFFSSLLPITQTFDNHQKLVFRTEVLKKAMEISTFKSNEDPMEFSDPASI